MMRIRKHIYYSGTVQGVGFRYTAMRVAANFDVAGYVRNMMDGRVEVVVEGESPEVEVFLAELAGAMDRYLRDVREVDEPYTAEFIGFDVKF
jgi:acylphosphatase